MDLQVIIIRGTPGVGKTTLGRLLEESFPRAGRVDIDEIRHFFSSEGFEYGENSHYFDALKIVAEIIRFTVHELRSPIIVIDVMAGDIYDTMSGYLCAYNCKWILLSACESEIRKRLNEREKGYKDLDVAINLNKVLLSSISEIDTVIDVTGKTPQEVLKSVLVQLVNIESSIAGSDMTSSPVFPNL